MDRRTFLKAATGAGAGVILLRDARSARGAPAHAKLHIALVGLGGRGAWFVNTIPNLGQNVVALCDVNDQKAAEAYQKFPDVPKFKDFRKMLDAMEGRIDAVVVAAPDHVHAAVAVASMRRGKHVYVEKSLAHDVYEARLMRAVARERKVATQMGNQGTASPEFRRAVDLIRAGALGEVRQVHVWHNGGGADRREPPKGSDPIPAYLDWDLWLGPAEVIRWDIPARGEFPPVTFHWHNGSGSGFREEIEKLLGDGLDWGDKGARKWQDHAGALIVGSKGKIHATAHNATFRLLPEALLQETGKMPETLPRSRGHEHEWIEACRGGPPALSQFDYAGPFEEFLLLGNVATRFEGALEYDLLDGKIANRAEADRALKRAYRKGWEL
jgi:hypothetical protein